jgi:ribonucleoside-diphosphate reductase alpha chain
LPADVHKRDLHQIHFQAWKRGVKSLYYCRSKSIQRAESAAHQGNSLAIPHLGKVPSKATAAQIDYEECLACQ